MKKTIVILTAALLLMSNNSYAAKIRVNNQGGIDADYTSLSTAVTNALSGDTIYVEPSGNSYGGATISGKKLYIIGPGYFVTQNPETHANPGTARINGTISIGSGSDGTVITGLRIYDGSIFIGYGASNIIIKRNYLHASYILFDNYNGAGSNIMILQNYIYESYSNDETINVESNYSNVLFFNNYINHSYSGGTSIWVQGSATVTFANNVIRSNVINNATTIFENNIFYGSALSDSSSPGSFFNNISDNPILPAGNSNLDNVDLSTVWDTTCTTCHSDDGRWQVFTGSVADNAGNDGTDAGMFGGNDPYKLSGIPSIPAIYYFNSPSTGSSVTGLPVRIKVKSHN